MAKPIYYTYCAYAPLVLTVSKSVSYGYDTTPIQINTLDQVEVTNISYDKRTNKLMVCYEVSNNKFHMDIDTFRELFSPVSYSMLHITSYKNQLEDYEKRMADYELLLHKQNK